MKKVLLSIFAVLTAFVSADACTNMIVGKNASADGSVMVSYNADSYGLFGNLYHWKAGMHAAGEMRQVFDWDSGRYLGEIPEAPVTYNVVGNMNEHQLCITETTFGGRRECRDKNGIVDYGSLIYITLQRATNAREAIKTMTELVTKYGYASGGESFSICDKNEAWIMELIGKGTSEDGKPTGAVWCAIRIPDDCISGHANQARITTFPQAKKVDKALGCYVPNNDVMYSADLIPFARKMGWFEGNDADFSFRAAYHPLTFSGIRACDGRVWSIFRKFTNNMDDYLGYINGDVNADPMPLYVKPNHKVSLREVKDAMRDHYEGTALDPTKDLAAGPYASPYRAPGFKFTGADGRASFNERVVGCVQSGFALVGQLRSWLPDAVGGILWFNCDDATMITYVPVYCCTYEVPEAFSDKIAGPVEFSMKSAFWMNNMVANMVYPRWSVIYPDLREAQNEMDDFFEADQKNTEALVANKNGDDRAKILNDLTASYTQKFMDRWTKLFELIVVKHNDMVVKGMKDGKFLKSETGLAGRAERPNYYTPEYTEEVKKATGDRYLTPAKK
ncbi:MAG: C69 family dipeptidase [Bacteroidaceae bacterium]|nr:C69 family dipeptidase [Bacteroidaceae bacterium]